MNRNANFHSPLTDYGPDPFVTNVDRAALINPNYRTVLWTGEQLQLALMKINVGEDIGLEVHPHTDQFIYIVQGCGRSTLGSSKDKLSYQKDVKSGYGVFVPAGTWHNLINTGNSPMKLFTLYAPPNHPHGTIHKTKAIAEAEEY